MPIEWERLLDTKMNRRTAGKVVLATGGTVAELFIQPDSVKTSPTENVVFTPEETKGTKEFLVPQNVDVITYHEVGDGSGFEYQVDFLIDKMGYVPISADTYGDYMTGVAEPPANHRELVITADDGRASQMNLFLPSERIQQRRGVDVSVLYFLIMQMKHSELPIEQLPDDWPLMDDGGGTEFMTIADAKKILLSQHKAGSHTVDHAYLPGLSLQSARDQISDAETHLTTIGNEVQVKRKYRMFAYPFGAVTPDIAQIVHDEGIDAGFTTGVSYKGTPLAHTAIPRIGKT